MERLKLQRVGRNYSGNIAYKDEKGIFYLDLNTATNAIPTELYHCHPSNDMDGEPGYHNDKYGLWGDTIAETIDELKRRWHEIPEDLKPEWCSWEDIVKLERKAELSNFQ